MTGRLWAGGMDISLSLLRADRCVDVFMAVGVLGLNVGTIFRSYLCGGALYSLPFRGLGHGRVYGGK